MVKYKKSHSDPEEEPAHLEQVVLHPNGIEAGDPPGDRSGGMSRMFRNKKYWAIAVAVLLGIIIGTCGVIAGSVKTHGAVAPSPAAPSRCPPGWIPNERRCYNSSNSEASWNKSQAICSSAGGSLVTPESQQELDFIKRHKNHIYNWIGLWRETDKEPWKRPDGSLFNAGSLFNDGAGILGDGLCAYMNNDKLRSTWCNNSQFWICSKPALLPE